MTSSFRISLFLLFFGFLQGLRRPVEAEFRLGYALTGDQIRIDAASHWRHWQVPTHAVEISPDGWIRPRFFRSRYNFLDDRCTFTRALSRFERRQGETAILNLDSTETLDVRGKVVRDQKGNPQYTYFLRSGISRVGSNPAAAASILDGDPRTFWEPDPSDSLYNAWIEVDLGRVVPVDELVLHFADPDLGDPFRQFRVLTAPDQDPIAQDVDDLEFEAVGGTQAPNRDQRHFRFSLAQARADPEWQGKEVETLRIVMTDTKGGRGRRIPEAEWDSLKLEERGDVVFFARDLEGGEEPVDRAVYAELPAERRGRREYFARERPRLADIEVWGWGDNISPGMIAGGGRVKLSGALGDVAAAFDGDIRTGYSQLIDRARRDVGALVVDMGATFWLEAMRLSGPWIQGYIVRASEGARDFRGRLRWQRLSRPAREEIGRYQYQHVQDLYEPPQKVRWLEMTQKVENLQGVHQVHLRELQLFARGYPAEVALTSDLIELPAARHFGRITWEGRTPSGTRLEIRTRTGDVRAGKMRYFDSRGSEVSYDSWKNLIGVWKGPTDTTFVPGSGWSSWSQPYRSPGERVISPGLRRFLQIQIEMGTESPDIAPALRALGIELLEPVAARLLAEIDPDQVPKRGQVDTFEVFVQPCFIEQPAISRSVGFDELLLVMPIGASMELLELGIDPQDGREKQVFRPASVPDRFVDGEGAVLQVLRNRADSIWVRLPVLLGALPESEQIYHRITFAGDQIPVNPDGSPLSAFSWGQLDREEKGDIRYFRRSRATAGGVRYVEVDRSAWEDLAEEEKGPIRYFRVLQEEGAQFPFDAVGDSLDAAGYERLEEEARGWVIAPGPLFRLRFRAPVFRPGTTLGVFARRSHGGADPDAPWQRADPGDATPGVASNTLSLRVPLTRRFLDAMAVDPNPFTPNGDGINDQTRIGFSVFQVTGSRKVRVRIYALDGRLVWETARQVRAGYQAVVWDGVDRWGRTAPPGLYLCQVRLDVDEKRGKSTCSRLLSLVY